MTRALAVFLLLLLAGAPAAYAAVRVVPPFDPDTLAPRGAVGLAVPGAGPTVTRSSALNTLLTGKVRSSLNGGTPTGKPRISLGVGGFPDTLVVLPPPG